MRRFEPETPSYTYDAEADGAKCRVCPLRAARAGGPVPSRFFDGALATVIAEAPGDKEVERGEPLVGPSGLELGAAWSAIGTRRSRFNYVNVLACRPPTLHKKQNNLRGFLHQLKATNKKRAAEEKPPIPSPFDCCRPRFKKDLRRGGTKNLIALGGTALEALRGTGGSIMDLRGGPLEAAGARILPTLHPAFVLRSRRYLQAFHADLSRAVRWFETGLEWRDPDVIYWPNLGQVRVFLAHAKHHSNRFTVIDVETAPGFSGESWKFYDSNFDKLRCLGLCLADGATAMVVPFRSKTDPGIRRFYETGEGRAIVRELRDFFAGPWMKAGHNLSYDSAVVEHHFGVSIEPRIDTIGLHKFASPELPHNLGYVGSVYTDVTSWKAGHQAENAETDEDLWLYNARDIAVTALAEPRLQAAVDERDQRKAYDFWLRVVQPACEGFHRNGMPVDQKARQTWDLTLLKAARAERKRCEDIARADGWSFKKDFNPGSTLQLRDLLFERWDFIPHEYTDLGDPSTGDDSLREFLLRDELTPRQRDFVKALRRYREKVKWRGTYVLKLRPVGEEASDETFAWDDDETKAQREERFKRQEKTSGKVLADGRVHPDWNSTGTVGHRLSSSNPNAQNYPPDLRNMIAAPPGYLLVGCDQAQIELRAVAALANDKAYLKDFVEKKDPHLMLCQLRFGDIFERASKAKKKELRVFVKQGTYGGLYEAEVETLHRILTSAETVIVDEATGRVIEEKALPWAQVSLSEVAAFHRTWLDLHPAIPRWWASLDREFQLQGFLKEPILGLRCDFLDGDSGAARASAEGDASGRGKGLKNKLANFKPQCIGAALVHIATERVQEEIPFQKWGHGTGLIMNGHDQLVLQVPDDGHAKHKGDDAEFGWCPPGCKCTANWTARLLQEAMTIHGKQWGLPVQFEGEAQIGQTWAEV